MAIGKSNGGYATINRSANYLGGAMQNAQDNAFRFRQERKVKEDEAKAEKEKIDNEINAGLGKISSDTTRFSTQNALIIDATHKLRNAVAEKANLYKNGKISKLDYDTFYANAKSQVDNIDQSAKRINAQSAEASNLIKDGKVNPAFAEYMANAGNAYDKNNVSLNLKDDGTFESILYDDNDNIIEVSDLSKFGVKTFTPITDYDLDKDLSEFVKSYPKVLNEEIKNNLKTGTKGTAPEIQTAIEEKVNSTLKDRNQMAIVNYKRTGRVNPDVTDPNEIEANKQYLTNLYNGLYATEKSVDEATGISNLKLNEAKFKEKQKQDAIDNALAEKQFAQKAKNDAEKLALAKAKASGKSTVSGTKFSVSKNLSQQSVLNGDKKEGDKVVIPNGSIGFAVQGDGLRRIIGEGDNAVVEDVSGVFYKDGAVYIEADRFIGTDDTGEPRYEKKYYNSNKNASEVGQFFTDRIKENGEYYEGVPEVIKEFSKKSKTTTPSKKTTGKTEAEDLGI